MTDTRSTDRSATPPQVVGTLIFCAAFLGAVYWWDRTYRRWLKEGHPLTGFRAGRDRLRAGYQRRRTSVIEVGQAVGDILVEVARARATITPDRTPSST
jgi:hypothetical protein